MQNKCFLFVFLVFFLLIASIHAQEHGALFYRNYTPKEYGASAQTNDIAQNHEGVLFFANQSGILIYNGITWKLIKMPNKLMAKSIILGNDSLIYVGGYDEFGYVEKLSNGDYHYVSLRRQIKKEQIDEVYTIHSIKNTTYFQTFNSLIKYENNRSKIITEGSFQMAHSVNNRLFMNHRTKGLFELINDSLVLIKASQKLAEKRIYVMLPYKDKNILIASQKQGLFILDKNYQNLPDKKALKPLITEDDDLFKKAKIYRAVQLPDNNYAIATRTAGIRLITPEGKRIRNLTTVHGLQNQNIKDLFIDIHQHLWIALGKGITSCEIMLPWEFWNETNGLKGAVNTIQKYNNTLFAGTEEALFCLKDNQFHKIENIDNWVKDLTVFLPDNALLIGNKTGIYQLKNNKIEQIHKTLSTVRSIENYYENFFFYFWRDHLVFCEYKNAQYHILKNIEIKGVLEKFIEDSNRYFWGETRAEGIYQIRFNDHYDTTSIKIAHYDVSKGLPTNENLNLFSYKNTLIVGTLDGFYSYCSNQDKFVKNDTILGSYFKNKTYEAKYFYEDTKTKKIWAALFYKNTNRIKIYEIDPENNYRIDSLKFCRLPKMEVKMIKTDNQYLYIGGSEGLFRYDLSKDKNFNDIFHTLILKIKLENDSLLTLKKTKKYFSENKSENTVLEYSKNSLTFYFTATYYNDETENRYSYMLEGYNSKWSKWNKNNFKEYTNLPQGEYTFKVKSKNIYGIEGLQAKFSFEIKPPWYKTLWAYILYIILIGVLIYSITKIYTINLRKQNEKLEKKVKKRTRQLEKKKKQLEEQKNEIELQAEELKVTSEELQTSNKKLTFQKQEIERAYNIVNRQNENIKASINYAQTIQQAILPMPEVINQLFEHFILFRPKDIVSGDFYWFTLVEDTVLHYPTYFIAVVDCTGHGVPGAFMSMIGNSLLNEIVHEKKIYNTALILDHLDKGIKKRLSQEKSQNNDGMDVCLCKIEKVKNEKFNVYFTGAKRPLIYIDETKNVQIIKGDKKFIGGKIKTKKRNFTVKEYTFAKNTTLFLTSDGYIDQNNPERINFGTQRLLAIIEENKEKSMTEICTILNNTLDEYMNGEAQRDDITIIGIRL